MVTSPLRIAFFGTPEFAVPTLQKLIDSRHDVVAVVSQPDRPKGRGHKQQPTPTKVTAEAAGVAVLQPVRIKDEEFLRTVHGMSLDLGVVAARKDSPDAARDPQARHDQRARVAAARIPRGGTGIVP